MKKLLIVVIVLLVAVLMTQTVPSKQEHKEAMMKAVEEYVEEEAENRGFSDNMLTNLGKNVVIKTIQTALNSKLKVNNYYLLNIGQGQCKLVRKADIVGRAYNLRFWK